MKNITAKELKNILEKKEVCVIDVREPIEHKSESIQGAYLIPLGSISKEKLPKTSHPIVIHCRSGKRSMDACQKLLNEDPSLNLYSLEEGIMAWKQEGFEIQKAILPTLPLERQTQLAAGFLAFTGTLMGTFISQGFYLIPGFVGAGLMFAGLTGWCGMAILLSKMPWNR